LQVCFEVLITDHLDVEFGDDHLETDPHIVRVGWSMDSTAFQLGNNNNICTNRLPHIIVCTVMIGKLQI